MKYLKITTILYDENEINNWAFDRLDEDQRLSLKNGMSVEIKRRPKTSTIISLIEDK
jgi:hypothetical protein